MTIESLRDMGEEGPRIFIYSTGAGAGIQKKIWEVPGCSSFLVGCGFPYATSLTSKYIGFTPEKFVSQDTAIELAMAAYLQAYEPGHKTIGVGLTASVASMSEHRGDHRIIASTFSDSKCFTFSATIKKGAGLDRRILDGNVSDTIGISLILKEAFKLDNDGLLKLMISPGEQIVLNDQMLSYSAGDATDYAKELILSRPYYHANGSRLPANSIDTNKVVFYPGSFNPFHFGHAGGAEAIRQTVAKKFGECRDVVYTTVIDPPHKSALTAAEMLNRVQAMKGKNFCLTSGDPLFIDKARRNPGAWFGLGIDTLITMLNPIWGIDPEELLKELNNLQTKIFVLGRLIKDEYITLSDVINKDKYSYGLLKQYENNMLIQVPGRWDISSTELRQK